MHVAGLYIHPIKSVAAISVDEIKVGPEGFDGDRLLAVSDPNGKALTARQFPKMLQIKATLDAVGLRLSAPEMTDLQVSKETSEATNDTIVWGDAVSSRDLGAEANEWLTSYLETEARLVAFGGTRLSQRYDFVSKNYADSAALLTISQASIDALNERLERPITVTNFRPNILVEGATAHDEDLWAKVQIGDAMVIEGLVACSRCVLTTIDPKTSEKASDAEPLRTLMKYRRRDDGQIYFGQNMRPTSEGVIRVGDPIKILERFDRMKIKTDVSLAT